MGLVKRILGKIVNLVVNQLGSRLGDSVCQASCNVSSLVTMQKGLSFLLNVLDLFFAHGTAHHVRLSKRITRQLLKNLDNLFLIDDAAICVRQDRLQ